MIADPVLTINGRSIGPDHPPYVIAELSANHNGDLGRAMAILRAAYDAGADAVKIQTYTADTITIDCDRAEFRIEGGLWHGRTLYDLYKEAAMPWEWHEPLFAEAARLGITIFSSPFDATAVKYLEDLDAPAYKIASFELVDHALIRQAAATGKPMILSTGMASLADIAEGVAAARESGGNQLALLHCVSGYPAPAEEANLRCIPHLAQAFDCVTGLSDHTLGVGVAVASVALGASIIEKHFTLARSEGGPDAAFSLEPDELRQLVDNSRQAWAALGKVTYQLEPSEQNNAIFRRSLYVVRDMAEGEVLTADNLRSIRPGFGLSPKYFDAVLGRRVNRAVPRGTPLSWTLIG